MISSATSPPLTPDLAAVASALEATQSSPPGDFSPAMYSRALELLSLAAEAATSTDVSAPRQPTFVSGDGRLFKLIYGMLFDKTATLRAGAATFFAWAGDNAPKDFDMAEILPKLGSGGAYQQFMVEGVRRGGGPVSTDALTAWTVTLRLLGDRIRQSTGTQLLNELLAVAERGFKSDNMSVRAETYRAWQALVDNFAQDDNVLAQPKRIKLLTRPLASTSGTNVESVIRAKFETFWYLIRKLANASKHMDSVVVPFLEFCYGHATGDHRNRGTHPFVSPVKKFGGNFSAACLDAFAQLLGCPPAGSSASSAKSVPPLALDAPVFETKDFLAYTDVLCNSMSEAFVNLSFANHLDVKRFEVVFGAISGFVHNLESSKNADEVHAVLAFLANVHDMVFKSKRNAASHATILFMLEEVRKMPSSLLCAMQSELDGKRPISVMIHVVLDPDLIGCFTSPNERLRSSILAIFTAFLRKGSSSKGYGLPFLGHVTNELEVTMAAPTTRKQGADIAATLWKAVADSLKDYISRYHEVNEIDSAVEHSTAAAASVLVFACRWLSSAPNRSIWKQWIELFNEVTCAAAVMLTFSALELAATVANCLQTVLAGPDVTVHTIDVACRILRYALLADVPFDVLRRMETDEKVARRVMLVLDLMGTLGRLLPAHQQEVEIASEAATNVCFAAKAFLRQPLSAQLTSHVVLQLPQLSRLMMSDLQRAWGKSFEEASDDMTEAAISLLQNDQRFTDKFDSELLAKLQPFVTAVLGHAKRNVKASAREMWGKTFGKTLDSKEVPAVVASLLRRTLLLPSPSPSSSSQVSSIEDSEDSPSPVPLTPSFGSFLNKGTPTKTAAGPFTPSSSATASPINSFRKSPGLSNGPSTPSPFKNFKRPQSSKKTSLEDESSQDFVPIKASAEKKRRVLTDHQREKLTTRSDDIPALYSELSRDDSVVALPPQFASQHSIDESSQMAMDAFAVRKTTEEEKEEEEQVSQSLLADSTPTTTTAEDLPVEDATEEEVDQASISLLSPSEGSKRRKGRPPIKNLPPVTKRLSEGDLPVVKRGRGRPRKSEQLVPTPPAVETAKTPVPETTAAVPPSRSSEKKRSAERTISDMTKAWVKLPCMSAENRDLAKRSPVKVLNENPLVIAPATAVIRTQEACAAKKGLKFGGDDDVDVIESSQKDAADDVPLATRKRFRRQGSLTNATNPSVSNTTNPTVINTTNPSLSGLVRDGDIARVRELLTSSPTGCDVHSRDATTGCSAVHEAMQDAPYAEEMIRLLSDHGANVNAQANDGNTPLHDAVRYLPEKLIRVLLECGADWTVPNKQGQTALDLAPADHKHLLENWTASSSSSGKLQNIMRDLTHEMEKSDNVANKENSEQPTHYVPTQPTTQVPESLDLGLVCVLGDRANCPLTPADAFTKLADKLPTPSSANRKGQLFSGRGAKLLELSKAKGGQLSVDTDDVNNAPVPMSPLATTTATVDPVLTTPTSRRNYPWQRHVPSPSNASPSTGILKRALSDSTGKGSPGSLEGSAAKRRRVQFMDPPVTDSAEIPRMRDLATGKRRPGLSRLKESSETTPTSSPKTTSAASASSQEESSSSSSSSQEDSNGLYVCTPPVKVSSETLYPSLESCEEPVSVVLAHLASQTWQKAAEKNLADNGIFKICDLARLTAVGASMLRGLIPPDNAATIRDALAKFERKRGADVIVVEKASPVVDISTPEEEEQVISEIYNRTSPSPPAGPVPMDEDNDDEDMPAILDVYRNKAPEKKSPEKVMMIPPPLLPTSTASVPTTSTASVQTASAASDTKQTQVEARDDRAVMEDVMRDLPALNGRMLVEVIERCSLLIKSKFNDDA